MAKFFTVFFFANCTKIIIKEQNFTTKDIKNSDSFLT